MGNRPPQLPTDVTVDAEIAAIPPEPVFFLASGLLADQTICSAEAAYLQTCQAKRSEPPDPCAHEINKLSACHDDTKTVTYISRTLEHWAVMKCPKEMDAVDKCKTLTTTPETHTDTHAGTGTEPNNCKAEMIDAYTCASRNVLAALKKLQEAAV
eukprot:NODE_5608_length_633_cov_38.270751_g5444_i0.p2 GENE.NODE_5608_length_633_cov_38.270751_g5444_i0~~NODE_5608_length_633_cov_38.270751_g5444_i0.p2  ORF type:complete len:155 (+),score=41.97 NODE_5608_length_633_cov_38.270751_g5444_i0:138-602(+)